jgi:hypothetical protein
MPRFLQGDANGPRYQRGSPPDYELNDNNVRTAKPFLLPCNRSKGNKWPRLKRKHWDFDF